MKSWLLEAMAYDQWANDAWINELGRFPDPEEPSRIMDHILNARYNWLARCQGEELTPPRESDFSAANVQLYRLWTELIDQCDPTAYISYQNQEGTQFFTSVQQIALHVVNHGTYHRGQLRAIAGAEGIDFPETDLIRYFRQLDQASS